MAVDINVSTLVPILLLIAVTISQVIRGVKPDNYTSIDAWKLIPFGLVEHPKLGVVTHLHFSINIVFLITYLITISSIEGGLIEAIRGAKPITNFILIIVIFLIWSIVPLLEFDEYQYIEPSKNHGHPESYATHIYLVISVSILTAIFEMVFRNASDQGSLLHFFAIRLIVASLSLVLLAGLAYGTVVFLNKFEDEIHDCELDLDDF
ncbi:hypothetical protein [Haloferax sp. YSMS24]|uniref:hypothetical protein n=1 Tax=Haloferax sp. YSMS24 TaxID=3388425 RepID=UPI00398C9F58